MKKYKRTNPKVVALIIEITVLVVGFIVLSILDGIGIKLNMLPLVIIAGVLIFALVLTLSLIRYDAYRDIRADGSFKKSNLPIYTDPTALQGHDIVEEKNKEEHHEN